MRRWAWVCAAFCLLLSAPIARAEELDTDRDGLSDRLEALFHTDPDKADTDGDGYPDGLEVAAGYSPLDPKPLKLEKELVVTISKQQLEQKLAGITLAVFPVSTGKAKLPTPTGHFAIKAKAERAWSRTAKLWMPWWMQFTAVKGGTVGIHELPEWPNGKKEGEGHLGRPVSHGCIRLGIGPAKDIYDWAPVGTKVTVKP